jgi:hypothetical protein
MVERQPVTNLARLSPGREPAATTQDDCEGRPPTGGRPAAKPRPGRVLCGTGHGGDTFLLAQTTTDCPGIDVKELSCPQPVTPRMLEDGTDDCVVQVAHTSAEREGKGKGR